MSKLYFKFGVMNSSKSAQLLMTKYNYEQKGFKVFLMKPAVDTRSVGEIRSRIGLSSKCLTFDKESNLCNFINENANDCNVVIVDEVQFCTDEQIEQLKEISYTKPTFCYGLKTDFRSQLFEGSKRLLELADSIAEIKSVCKCGRKAIINARILNGKVVSCGNVVEIGSEEKYEAMCYNCWKSRLDKQN